MTKNWDAYKDEIIRLYKRESKPLREVIEIMRADYGFVASTRTYRSRLDEWGISKYHRRKSKGSIGGIGDIGGSTAAASSVTSPGDARDNATSSGSSPCSEVPPSSPGPWTQRAPTLPWSQPNGSATLTVPVANGYGASPAQSPRIADAAQNAPIAEIVVRYGHSPFQANQGLPSPVSHPTTQGPVQAYAPRPESFAPPMPYFPPHYSPSQTPLSSSPTDLRAGSTSYATAVPTSHAGHGGFPTYSVAGSGAGASVRSPEAGRGQGPSENDSQLAAAAFRQVITNQQVSSGQMPPSYAMYTHDIKPEAQQGEASPDHRPWDGRRGR